MRAYNTFVNNNQRLNLENNLCLVNLWHYEDHINIHVSDSLYFPNEYIIYTYACVRIILFLC